MFFSLLSKGPRLILRFHFSILSNDYCPWVTVCRQHITVRMLSHIFINSWSDKNNLKAAGCILYQPGCKDFNKTRCKTALHFLKTTLTKLTIRTTGTTGISLSLNVCVGSLNLHHFTGSAFVIMEKTVNVCLPIHIKEHTGILHLLVMEGNWVN